MNLEQSAYICLTEQDVVVTALALFSKMCIAGSFNLWYVYMAELMPTEVRSVGFGMCDTFGRSFRMVAPFIGGHLVSS